MKMFQDKAYEYWRKGCDSHTNDPCARSCMNAGLLDSLEPNTKIGGVEGFKNADKHLERKGKPDKLKVKYSITQNRKVRLFRAQNRKSGDLY